MALADINEFRAWLKKRLSRNDIVGNFANYFLADGSMRNATTLSTIDRIIKENWGDRWEEYVYARDLAWREWKGHTSGPQRTLDGQYWSFDGSVWRKSCPESTKEVMPTEPTAPNALPISDVFSFQVTWHRAERPSKDVLAGVKTTKLSEVKALGLNDPIDTSEWRYQDVMDFVIDHGGQTSVRQLQKGKSRRYATAEQAKRALEFLVETRRLQRKRYTPAIGRPVTIYVLNGAKIGRESMLNWMGDFGGIITRQEVDFCLKKYFPTEEMALNEFNAMLENGTVYWKNDQLFLTSQFPPCLKTEPTEANQQECKLLTSCDSMPSMECVLDFIKQCGGVVKANELLELHPHPDGFGAIDEAKLWLKRLASEGYGNVQVGRDGATIFFLKKPISKADVAMQSYEVVSWAAKQSGWFARFHVFASLKKRYPNWFQSVHDMDAPLKYLCDHGWLRCRTTPHPRGNSYPESVHYKYIGDSSFQSKPLTNSSSIQDEMLLLQAKLNERMSS